jgi:hypothetical protein
MNLGAKAPMGPKGSHFRMHSNAKIRSVILFIIQKLCGQAAMHEYILSSIRIAWDSSPF